QLLHHLLDHELVAGDDDGHAGDAGIERLADRQALDVVAAGREQPGHPGEHAELVLDQHRDRVLAGLAAVAGHQKPVCDLAACSRTSRVGGARIMSVLAPPAGTIGNTHSSLSTMTSRMTGAGVLSIFSIAGTTSLGLVTRRPTQP